MLPEERMDILLKAVYQKGSLNLYDFCAEEWKNEEEVFFQCKAMADELVNAKLVKYNDEQRTELIITNYGRFWVTQGGFLIYLKEGERKIKKEHEKDNHHDELNEELKEARLKFTQYRIVTYWWGIALTLISFLLSMLNLYLILRKN